MRRTPHPVIGTMRDNGDYFRGPLIFLLYYYSRHLKPDCWRPQGIDFRQPHGLGLGFTGHTLRPKVGLKRRVSRLMVMQRLEGFKV